jgi:hypothetical protein
LNSLRSVTLKLGCSSLMTLLNHTDTEPRKHESCTFLCFPLWLFRPHFRLTSCLRHSLI